MGLSGRKEKQRIPNDPRNLGWSDDAARFGTTYMSKFGWDASKGLGAEGDGRTTHLKVAQKLDMLGIGAAHTRDPNGIAWKQNRDFERLLARLNGNAEDDDMKVEGFARAAAEEPEEVAALVEEDEDAERRARKERKREKRAAKEAAAGEGKTMKKRKAEELDEPPVLAAAVEVVAAPVASTSAAPVRGHRARHVRAKRMALADSVAMAEVLGIAPASSTVAAAAAATANDAPAAMPSGVLEEMEKLTTSTKSVMDYFKEKLLAKSNGASGSGTPAPVEEDEGFAPRRGLGAARPALGGFTSFSTARVLPQDSSDTLLDDSSVSPSDANKETSSVAEAALPLVASLSLADDAAMKKAAKRARKEAKRIAKEIADAPVVDPAVDDRSVKPSSLEEDATPVDDAAAIKAAKRARKEAKRLAKTLDHSSPQDPSKEDRKRRRREERASAITEA